MTSYQPSGGAETTPSPGPRIAPQEVGPDDTPNRKQRRANAHEEYSKSRDRKTANAAVRKWAKANQLAARANSRKREKRLKQARPPWVNPSELKGLELQRQLCELVTGQTYHLHHVIPIVGESPEGFPVSGLDVIANIQLVSETQHKVIHREHGQQVPPYRLTALMDVA